MTDAVRALIPFIFATWACTASKRPACPTNEPSRNLLAKAGFREEGLARRYLLINGEWRDHLLFALLEDEAALLGQRAARLARVSRRKESDAMKRLFLAADRACVLAGLRARRAAADAPPHAVDFGGPTPMSSTSSTRLTPYHAPGGPEADGSAWYMLTVTNNSVRPATRVLLAGQPPRMALRLLPRPSRPAILAVASSDSGVVVEPAKAYGRRAWRVIMPPVTTVGLAVRVGNAGAPPSLLAWTEPALASHNRQLAIFITAVGGLDRRRRR